MKVVVGITLLCISLGGTAQASEEMMQQLAKMQRCLESVDQAEIEALKQHSQKLQQEIASLCKAGKQQQAQKKAMSFGLEVADSKPVKQVAKCAKIMQGIIPEMPMLDFDKDYSTFNICESQL